LKAKIAEAETQTIIAADETQKARKAMGEAQEARQRATAAEREGRVMAASKIETVASTLTQNARALEDNVKRSRHGAEVQKERVTETATAMEEMNATVLEVAGNASRAAQSSDVARHTAQNGAAIVARVVTAINDVRTQAISLTQNISQLGQSAQAIGQIIGVINDIADQTNLLALNAAIEAGRGFAVVADEVRKLAEKTMSATGEVGKAIRGIQDLTRVNVDNVEKAVATIETVSTLANESGASLRDIVNLVEESSMQVAAIATAAEEQSAASNEINRSVLEVHNISTETADGMEASSRAVADVNHEIESLRNLIRELQR